MCCVRAVQLSNITENRSLWKRWCRNLNDATWPEVQCRSSGCPVNDCQARVQRVKLLFLLLFLPAAHARLRLHRAAWRRNALTLATQDVGRSTS